ncbi:MAG: 50S ribosomal protein L1 [Ignavibacteriae bacterium]|nr:MAG: 50S ribosomal protein L1 [Ignavibacteriota bacterium]
MKTSKRRKEIVKKTDLEKEYTITEAISKVKETATAKFDESVDIAIRLGVDPRQADQLVRGTVTLPHGTGKTKTVLVIAKLERQEDAKNAGADFVGFEDYLKMIQEGWAGCDVIIATPDVMSELGKLGKILGPKGLMPNPKSGTVTPDIAKAVKEVKAGRIEFRVDKAGIVHAAVGKASFEVKKLEENLMTFINQIIKMKPQTAKGQYVRSVTLNSSMGPGYHINRNEIVH